MDEWLRDEIEAAKKRREQKERKLARRQLDAQVIATQQTKFWASLLSMLQASLEEFNRSGASDEPVEFNQREDRVWIRAPSYPSGQLFLEYREGNERYSNEYNYAGDH